MTREEMIGRLESLMAAYDREANERDTLAFSWVRHGLWDLAFVLKKEGDAERLTAENAKATEAFRRAADVADSNNSAAERLLTTLTAARLVQFDAFPNPIPVLASTPEDFAVAEGLARTLEQKWKERCEALEAEVKAVRGTLDNYRHQAKDYHPTRQRLHTVQAELAERTAEVGRLKDALARQQTYITSGEGAVVYVKPGHKVTIELAS